MFGPILLLISLPFYIGICSGYLKRTQQSHTILNYIVFVVAGYVGGLASLLLLILLGAKLHGGNQVDGVTFIVALLGGIILALISSASSVRLCQLSFTKLGLSATYKILGSIGAILVLFIYFTSVSPVYNPYTAKHSYTFTSLEWGFTITNEQNNILVPAEFSANDSCYFLTGQLNNPIDPATGKCPDPFCVHEGYFILDKKTSIVTDGLSKSEFDNRLATLKPFGLGSGKSFTAIPHRFYLSFTCPLYEILH